MLVGVVGKVHSGVRSWMLVGVGVVFARGLWSMLFGAVVVGACVYPEKLGIVGEILPWVWPEKLVGVVIGFGI